MALKLMYICMNVTGGSTYSWGSVHRGRGVQMKTFEEEEKWIMSGVMCQISYVMCHILYVAFHLLPVTFHVSPVTSANSQHWFQNTDFLIRTTLTHPDFKSAQLFTEYYPHRSRHSVSPVCGIFPIYFHTY